jgi:hypothetical protein
MGAWTQAKQKRGRGRRGAGPKAWASKARAQQKRGSGRCAGAVKLWGPKARAKQKGSRGRCAGVVKLWDPKARAKQKGGREGRTPAQKAWSSLAIAVSLLIVGAAERDIQGRSEAEVRGRKLLWRVVSLNALGALVYFLWGRQEVASEASE